MGPSEEKKSVENGEKGAAKKPNPIDIHVGSRVRLRRMVLGISQEKLGEKLGLTFQQVQKYEKGVNRISASRLYQLCTILDVPVQFFFDEVPLVASSDAQPGFAEGGSDGQLLDLLNSREGLELNRAFAKISDPRVRRKVIELVRSIADGDEVSES